MKRLLTQIHYQQTGAILTVLIILFMAAAASFWAYGGIKGVFDRADPDTGQTQQETEVREYHGFGVWYSTEKYDYTSQLKNQGEVFIAPETMVVTEIQKHIGLCGDDDGDYYRARFYEWDDVAEDKGDLVGESDRFYTSELQQWCGSSPNPIPTFTITFTNEVLLVKDAEYILMYDYLGGGGTSSSYRYQPVVGKEDATTLGWKGSTTFYDDRAQEYWVTGYAMQEPDVTTIGAEVRTDGSVWLTGWADNFAEMTAGFYVSEDEATVTAGAGVRYDGGTIDPDEPRHYFSTRVVSILSDVTYYYRAYAEINGQYYYGAVKSFQRLAADMLPQLNANVIQNNLDVVEFEVNFIDVPATTSWNITLFYGRDISECYSHNYSIIVDTSVTADDVWYIQEPPTTFDYGAKYWYYACAAEELGSSVCSPLRNLVIYHPDQPAGVNWLAGITGLSFDWLWWVLVIIGLGVVWFIAAQRKWWWMGVIGTAVAMILLITFGYVNPWLVVVLVIIVGWIIFKLVFKRSGGTSS